MVPVIRVDDQVFNELQERAVRLGLVFGTPNQVLRDILGLQGRTQTNQLDIEDTSDAMAAKLRPEGDDLVSGSLPSSSDSKVRELLDGVLPTICSLSKGGLKFHPLSGKWGATPSNFVAMKVQDARVRSLAFVVYGGADDFPAETSTLHIRRDRSAYYSRFTIDTPHQIAQVIKVIQRAYALKQQRGR